MERRGGYKIGIDEHAQVHAIEPPHASVQGRHEGRARKWHADTIPDLARIEAADRMQQPALKAVTGEQALHPVDAEEVQMFRRTNEHVPFALDT